MWGRLHDANVPLYVYAVNDPGVISVAYNISPNAVLIYRDVVASTVNPADYNHDAADMAKVYWQRTLDRLPVEIAARKDRVWLELLNEPGREPAQARWVGRLMTGMAQLALAAGWRVMGPGWAPGNPEIEAWDTPEWREYLALCAAHPDRVAVSLHEYSLERDNIMDGEAPDGSRWMVGRYEHLHAAVDKAGIARPNIYITECGWTLNDMPASEQAQADIRRLAALYGRHSNVKAAFLWTLQGGDGNGKLPQRLNALMPWLTDYALNPQPPLVEEPYQPPGEQPTPPAPPAPPPGALLTNGSFEGEWYHPDNVPELQIPVGWTFKWRSGDDPGWLNPYDPSPAARFVRPEVRVLPADQLPDAERPVFVRDGCQTVKVFKGGGSWYASLMQTVSGLTTGARYRLTTPVFPDVVMRYESGRKVWADDGRACLWRVRVGATVAGGSGGEWPFGGGWQSLKAGTWNETAAEFTASGPTADVKVDFMLPFPLPQNGIFTDQWQLEAVPVAPPAPPPPTPLPTLPIVDVSHHQGRINWDVFSKQVAAAIIRLGYGVTEDREARRNVAEAVRLNVPFAVYHYFVPAVDPVAQGEFFGKLAGEIAPGRRMAPDLEETGGVEPLVRHILTTPSLMGEDISLFAGHGQGRFADEIAAEYGERAALEATLLPVVELRERARRYVETLERYSGDACLLIYTGQWYWGGWLNYPAWGAKHDLWIAAWTSAARPVVPRPWTTWRIWQYAVEEIKPAEWGVQSQRLDKNRHNSAVIPDLRQYLMTGPPSEPVVDFATALWDDAGKRYQWVWNSAAALAKAIVKDGLIPVSHEFRFEHGGKVWFYQVGMSGDRQTRRVYYVEKDKWNIVKWIAGPGVTPPPPTTPAPPPAPSPVKRVDLLPFLRGDHRRAFDMGYDRGTQNVQVWHLSGTDWLYIKGENGEYEHLGLRLWNGEEWIFRFEDTSESPERLYAHYERQGGALGAPWFPRYAEVGRWYETTKFVQHYLKAGCKPKEGQTVTDRLRLTSWPRAVTYAASLARLDEIVTIEWGGGEQYDFGRGRGCVAFRDANRLFWYIGDVQGRADKQWKKPDCIRWE